jgi:hypothetical protein
MVRAAAVKIKASAVKARFVDLNHGKPDEKSVPD